MSLNPDAKGFQPFGSSTSSLIVTSNTNLKQPEKPGPDATPEQIQQFKEALRQYVIDLKAEKERLARANEETQRRQAAQPKYIVETVYADEVGLEDDWNGNDQYDGQEYFDGFGEDQGDNYGEEEEFIDDLQAVDKNYDPASQFQGKDLTADELFRIAKTARANRTAYEDFFGCEAELVARTSLDLRSHADSYKRSVLHFAAEGGNAKIVDKLREVLGEYAVLAIDDKGLSPWQVAVLCRQTETAKRLIPQTGVQGINQPQDLENEALFSNLLANFAPKSATANLAFGAKPPTLIGETHKVWGNGNAANLVGQVPNVRTQSIQCSTLDPLDLNTMQAYEEIVTNFGNNRRQAGGLSFFQWAQPMVSTDFASRDKFSHLVAAFESESNLFVGCAVYSALGMLAGPKVPPQMLGVDNYFVSSVGVASKAPTSTLHAIMLQSHVDYQGSNVFVRTAAKLPMGNPVANVKWMYRILKPWNVFVEDNVKNNANKSPTLCSLRMMLSASADYEKYASTSMVDTVIRQAISRNYPVNEKELSTWEILQNTLQRPLADSDAEQIANCVNKVVNSESAFGVHWNDMIVKAIALASDLKFCIRRGGPNGSVSDLIVFKTANASGTNNSITAAILVGMWCPTVAKGRRAVVASSVAGVLLNADVLFTTNTFGLTNTDLVNSFFEDLAGSLEKIYSLNGVDRISPLPPVTQASQVYVPFF